MDRDARCEPPPEWRGVDGVHWLQYREHPMNYAEWIAAERAWFFPHDQVVSPVDSMSTEWRYVGVAATPAEVAELRAERDDWNRRTPSAEEARLRAEVASLRAALGQQPATEGAEPVGCPIPGMCAAVAAHAAAYRAGAEAMRERAAREVACGCPNSDAVLAAETKADRWRACSHDPCGAIEAAAIRALPLPEAASGWRDMDDKPAQPMPVIYWFGKRWWHQADGTPATPDPVRDPAERTEVGWWNGEEWCESGTGHDVFEPWREERDLPTAWQPMPAAPDAAATFPPAETPPPQPPQPRPTRPRR